MTRLQRRRREAINRLCKVALAVVYLFVLSMAGMGFNGSYSIFNTLARTPPGAAAAVDDSGILQVDGEFNPVEWLQSGSSGIMVTNVSSNRLWVYFTLDGNLDGLVRHINPVNLKPGEKWEVPLQPARLGELGLLGVRNNGDEFTGQILARVLNNFTTYELGTVTVSGEELYAALVQEEDDSEGLLAGIKSVGDILQLIAERAELIDERDGLLVERDELLKANEELEQERDMLQDRVLMLENHVNALSDSLSSAYDTIHQYRQQEEVQNPSPAEPIGSDPEQEEGTGTGGTDDPGQDDSSSGDAGGSEDQDTTGEQGGGDIPSATDTDDESTQDDDSTTNGNGLSGGNAGGGEGHDVSGGQGDSAGTSPTDA